MLAECGVEYCDLAPALVPQLHKAEVCFLFDRTTVASVTHLLDIHRTILKSFDRRSTHSVLTADLIAPANLQSWFQAFLDINLISSGRPFVFKGSNEIYAVYINNISTAFRDRLHQELKTAAPYIGYADCTFASPFKTFLSQKLQPRYVKCKGATVQSHGDDRIRPAHENDIGYPFASAGYEVWSLPDIYFGVFLSYKIERPVLSGYETDSMHTLAAVSDNPYELGECGFEIDQRKFEYLMAAKSGTLKHLGVLGQPRASLEQLVAGKLRSNYIYNVGFSSEYRVAKFNMMLELEAAETREPVRVQAVFKYSDAGPTTSLITLFG